MEVIEDGLQWIHRCKNCNSKFSFYPIDVLGFDIHKRAHVKCPVCFINILLPWKDMPHYFQNNLDWKKPHGS